MHPINDTMDKTPAIHLSLLNYSSHNGVTPEQVLINNANYDEMWSDSSEAISTIVIQHGSRSSSVSNPLSSCPSDIEINSKNNAAIQNKRKKIVDLITEAIRLNNELSEFSKSLT
jgi:hypothetical protein